MTLGRILNATDKLKVIGSLIFFGTQMGQSQKIVSRLKL